MRVTFATFFYFLFDLYTVNKITGYPFLNSQNLIKMDFSNNKVLTFEQGCQYLGYAKSCVYKMTASGILPFSKPNNKKIFFEREKLEAWMLSNANSSHEEKEINAATYVSTHH